MATRTPAKARDSEAARPDSVAALLALDDLVFVRSAYPALLGREADEEGEASYLAQVRAGFDKRRLLADLARSTEGRTRPRTLTGLTELLNEVHPQPAPWPRRVVRALLRKLGGPAREPLERSLRAMDNRLYRLETLLKAQHDDIGRLHEELAQLAIGLQALRVAAPAATQPATAPAPQGVVALGPQAPARVEYFYRLMSRTSLRQRDGTR